ncbi:DUF1566 domain-containing protein [Cysteiniphilum halobium]|uniref:Lcl C-terminal domain-containing protein n=1 Tax=Cysteiniphilum halobium TaxID=2219059 RepID=UPI003F844001
MSKVSKIGKTASIVMMGYMISGCKGSPSGDSGGGDGKYAIQYPKEQQVFVGADAQFAMLVTDSAINIKAAKQRSYSIAFGNNPNVMIHGSCNNIPMGTPCKVFMSLKSGAAKTEKLDFEAVLSDGIKQKGETILERSNLIVDIANGNNTINGVVLSAQKKNTITVTNSSKENAYISKPMLVDNSNHEEQGVTVSQSTCDSVLAPSEQCHFVVTASKSLHDLWLKLDLADEPILSNVSFSDVVVSGNVVTEIPANSAEGSSYPFGYMFTNTSTQLPATEVNFSSSFSSNEFSVTSDTCSSIKTLAAGGSCVILGHFKPQTEGDKTMSLSFSYDDGAKVSYTKTSTTSKLAIIDQADYEIPANSAVGVIYPFMYTFTNTSKTLTATDVKLTTHLSPADDFSVTENSCANSTNLPAGQSCSISGEFIPSSEGDKKQMAMILSYNDGSEIRITRNSSTSKLVITKSADQEIPANSTEGVSYPFKYTFTNPNKTLTATGVHINSDFTPVDEFQITSDSCNNATGQLLPSSQCVISGNFTPKVEGNDKTINITFNYNEGVPIVINKQSKVSKVIVKETKNTIIPENTVNKGVYSFKYTFTNTNSNLPATGVEVVSSFMPSSEFSITGNSCNSNTTLAAGESCDIAGQFTPQINGAKLMTINFSYNEGSTIHIKSASTTTDVEVTADKVTGLPAVSNKNGSYNFDYQFTNKSQTTAITGVSITSTSTPASDFKIITNTCQGINSLAAGKSCEVSGTFAPTTQGDKTIALSLSYDGGTVSVNDASFVILATTPINTGPNTPNEHGYPWPASRFEPAKGSNDNLCDDALDDTLTGLMWAKDGAAAGLKNWSDAKTYAAGLSLCGYHDWRLPTINELATLVNYSAIDSPADWLNANGFTDVNKSNTINLWSSTGNSFMGGSPHKWSMSMIGGSTSISFQEHNLGVLPVRGPVDS